MNPPTARKTVAFASVVALIFGVLTVASGVGVLLGADPGYAVFRPLLIFNTTMGFAYAATGLLAWRCSRLSLWASAGIALLNLAALAFIAWLYSSEGLVAVTSLQAMTLRTAVWAAIFFLLAHAMRSTARR